MQTLLIVTNDQSFADRMHRIIEMEDGRIIKQENNLHGLYRLL